MSSMVAVNNAPVLIIPGCTCPNTSSVTVP